MVNLIFWGIIVVVALTGLKQRFLYALCTAFAFCISIYFSFWMLEPVTGLISGLPMQFGDVVRLFVFIALFTVFFLVFRPIMLAGELCLENSFPEEEELFSRKICFCGTFIANLISGAALAVFLYTAVAITPFCKTVQILSSPEITRRASGGIRFISGFVDTLTWQSGDPETRERLMRKSFGRPTPEEADFFNIDE